jgi:hypothetical protein
MPLPVVGADIEVMLLELVATCIQQAEGSGSGAGLESGGEERDKEVLVGGGGGAEGA